MRLTRSLLVSTLAVASFVAPVAGTESAWARSPRVTEPDPITFVLLGRKNRTYGPAVLSRRGHVAFTFGLGEGMGDFEERVALWDQGVTSLLGPATTEYATVPSAVNEHRTVVGQYLMVENATGGPFVWSDGVMRLLGQPGEPAATAVDVNERDEVLLNRQAADADWFRASTLRQGRERVSPDVLDGRILTGASINNSGQVAGSAVTGDVLPQQPNAGSVQAPPVPRLPVRQAFVWEPGDAPVALDNAAGALSTESLSINNAGSVTGAMVIADHRRRTFFWRDGRMVDLGTLGGRETSFAELNELDQVVGQSQRPNGAFYAFRWTDGEMLDLGTLGGHSSEATALNNQGDVVGTSVTATGRYSAFLWRDGAMVDLGAVVPGAFWSRAYAINNRGQVLGTVSGAVGDRLVVWDTLGRG